MTKAEKKIGFYEQLTVAQEFEDFIISALTDEVAKEKGEAISSLLRNGCYSGDLFLPKGIKRFENRPCIIEVKYTNNLAFKFDNRMPKGYIRIYITCVDDDKIADKFKSPLYSNLKVFGKNLIKSLAQDHIALWWKFACLASPKSNILLSEDGTKAVLDAKNILGLKNFKTEIELKDIHKISDANSLSFKRKITQDINESYYKPAMFVGNGSSIAFGSDPWNKLVDEISDYLTPFYVDDIKAVRNLIGGNGYTATKLAQNTLKSEMYIDAVRNGIYRKYIGHAMHNKNTLIRAITKIKSKYKNMPLCTYNYDFFLEEDYNLLNPKSHISTVKNSRSNKKTVEPKVVHLHGYLPYKASSKDKNVKLVLTHDDYLRAYSGDGWIPKYQKQLLDKYTCLYVGSSMSDVYQMSLIDKIRKKKQRAYDKHQTLKSCRNWRCYALMCLNGISNKDRLIILRYFDTLGVSVIYVENFYELPAALESLFA